MPKKKLIGFVIIICLGIGVSVLLTKGLRNPQISELKRGIISNVNEVVTEKQLFSKKPSNVIQDFYEALKSDDYVKAANYVTEDFYITGASITILPEENIKEGTLRYLKEEFEKKGYTKVEITEEEPITGYNLIVVKTTEEGWCKGGETPSCEIDVTKEDNKWKVSDISCSRCAIELPGKIEFSPSPESSQGIALGFFKALQEGNIDKAKNYLGQEGRKSFESYPSDVEDPETGLYKPIGNVEEPLKNKSKYIKENIETIKGVIQGEFGSGGKLKFCAKDVYCDNYRFRLRQEDNILKIKNIELLD